MPNGRNPSEIKRLRNEILMALRMVYPAALQADQVLRSLMVLFPTLEFEQVKRDLHYLAAKNYVERVLTDHPSESDLTPWRRRWFRLAPSGVEVADRCIHDPALDD